VATNTASRQLKPLVTCVLCATPQQIQQTVDFRACGGSGTDAARHAVSPSAAGPQPSPTTNFSTYSEGGVAMAGTDAAP